jgi:hypothetical protein
MGGVALISRTILPVLHSLEKRSVWLFTVLGLADDDEDKQKKYTANFYSI